MRTVRYCNVESTCSNAGGVGAPITDPTGADHVHIGRNQGTVALVLEVTYVSQAGAATSDSAPNPDCNFSDSDSFSPPHGRT